MEILKTVLLILFAIDCIALTVIVLMQEGKQAGLTGAISGAAESYWGKNKGRSMEGGLVLATRIMAVLFVVFFRDAAGFILAKPPKYPQGRGYFSVSSFLYLTYEDCNRNKKQVESGLV